ncbi:DnaJ-like protein [Frankia sp. EI5c]|uniref:J domain-containing protein n=1 Tax=Frankia sp. EI5c TaxID=683316 RepID=UPI0007C21BFB|nr:DnaJ domain-containing protein [Frankia sp. EI5c]OAA25585.1 DnaJ-like protein [Frankia sp. EI5c]
MRDTPKSQSAQYLRASMYEVLGIAPTASDEEVHAAYRRVVKRAHPDAGGSQRAFLRVNAAYRVLSDPGMRRAHDLWLAHLLDAYDQPGRSGGARSPQGRGTPGGHTTDGRPTSGRRPGSGGRPNPGAPGTSGRWGPPGDQTGTAGPPGTGPGSPGPWTGAGAGPTSGKGYDPAGPYDPSGQYDPTGQYGPTGQGAGNGPLPASSPGGRRRARRRPQPADGLPGQPGEPGQPETWATWSDEERTAWGPDRRARRRYLVSMALCLALFALAGAVVRLYSIPVALGMTAAAMVIPPLAVFAVNTARRR